MFSLRSIKSEYKENCMQTILFCVGTSAIDHLPVNLNFQILQCQELIKTHTYTQFLKVIIKVSLSRCWITHMFLYSTENPLGKRGKMIWL